MYEGGGGANFRLLYALGDKLAGDDGSFIALSTFNGIAANHGWSLIPEPGSSLLALLGCSVFGLRRRRS